MARSTLIARLLGFGRGLNAWHASVLFSVPTVAQPLARQALRNWASVPDNKDSVLQPLGASRGWTDQLPRDPLHLFDANIFAPLPLTLAFSDAILLEGAAAAPGILPGLPVVYVLNALVLASFPACGLGAFLLVRELTDDAASAVVAGVIFAFAPYRFDHYYHLELLWAQWLPLNALDGAPGAQDGAPGARRVGWKLLRAPGAIVHLLCRVLRRRAGRADPRARERAFRFRTPAGDAPARGGSRSWPRWDRGRICCLYRAARDLVGDREPGSVRVYSAGPAHYLAALPSSVIYGAATPASWLAARRSVSSSVSCPAARWRSRLWPPLDRRRVAYALALALAIDGTLLRDTGACFTRGCASTSACSWGSVFPHGSATWSCSARVCWRGSALRGSGAGSLRRIRLPAVSRYGPSGSWRSRRCTMLAHQPRPGSDRSGPGVSMAPVRAARDCSRTAAASHHGRHWPRLPRRHTARRFTGSGS